jgi:hypothetical protein
LAARFGSYRSELKPAAESRQLLRWRIAGGRRPLGPAVHLERDVEPPARLDDEVRLGLRLGAPATDVEPAGAVAEDLDVRVGDRRNHAPCHRVQRRPQLRVHARNDDAEACEQVVVLVKPSVLEDVDLDAGE